MRYAPIFAVPALLLAFACGQGEDNNFQGAGDKSAAKPYKSLNETESADAAKKTPAPKSAPNGDAATGLEDDDADLPHDHADVEPDAPETTIETPAPRASPEETPAKEPAAAPMTPAAPVPTPAPAGPAKDPNVVEFRIKAGTGNKPWNLETEMITAKVTQTVRIYNDDTIVHRLHTGGAPCPHGPDIAPGASFDCKATKAFDPKAAAGPVYDHIAGPTAKFWLQVTL